jgi:hypothetical protein
MVRDVYGRRCGSPLNSRNKPKHERRDARSAGHAIAQRFVGI